MSLVGSVGIAGMVDLFFCRCGASVWFSDSCSSGCFGLRAAGDGCEMIHCVML